MLGSVGGAPLVCPDLTATVWRAPVRTAAAINGRSAFAADSAIGCATRAEDDSEQRTHDEGECDEKGDT
jgi:hypothetical protein